MKIKILILMIASITGSMNLVNAMEHSRHDSDLELAIALSLLEAEHQKGEKEVSLAEQEQLQADREFAEKLQATESGHPASKTLRPAIREHVTIRDMDPKKDKKFVKNFMRKNFDTLIGGVGSGLTLEDHFKDTVKHKNKIISVDGKPTGFISWGRTTGLIYMIYVAPKFRNKGYAEQLLAEAQKDLKKRGGKQITAEVYKSNPKARKFFEKAGFTVRKHKLPQFWKLIKSIR